MRRCHAIVWVVICLSGPAVKAQFKLQIPSLPSATLKEQFPKESGLGIPSLRKYRQDLEFFRNSILEGYNRALIRHAQAVKDADLRLESAKKRKAIDSDQYELHHQMLKEELARLSKDGEYFKLYTDYLDLYRKRMMWADQLIAEQMEGNRRRRYTF